MTSMTPDIKKYLASVVRKLKRDRFAKVANWHGVLWDQYETEKVTKSVAERLVYGARVKVGEVYEVRKFGDRAQIGNAGTAYNMSYLDAEYAVGMDKEHVLLINLR